MICAVDKQTYTEGRAYRYHISDEQGRLQYIAERTGLFLPSPTHLVEFFNPDHSLSARLHPPTVMLPWRWGSRYELLRDDEPHELHGVIRRQWRLVDLLLLRLPRYDLQLGEHRYVARGSRYGEHFYEILCLDRGNGRGSGEGPNSANGLDQRREGAAWGEMKVAEIQRPASGPSYVVEASAMPLGTSLLMLAALVILIDIEMFP